jgi:hypothetical protein
MPLPSSTEGAGVTKEVRWQSYLLHRAGEIVVRLDQARHDDEVRPASGVKSGVFTCFFGPTGYKRQDQNARSACKHQPQLCSAVHSKPIQYWMVFCCGNRTLSRGDVVLS